MRLPPEEFFDFTPKSVIKGSVVGLVVGAGLELQKWLSTEENQKDVTDLLANLTSMAVKTVVGTLIGIVLAGLISRVAPVGLIIAVGVLVAIGVGLMLDYTDDLIGGSEGLRKLYNHVQGYSQNTIKNMVDKGNKILGLNYVLPSWSL